jgi:uncharacterized membrane protein
MSSDPAEIEAWLRRLKWSLASMPAPERDNILDEARSHLREVLAKGCTPAAALKRFGRAEDYARHFVEEMQIMGALGSRDSRALLQVLTSQLSGSIVGTLAVIGMAALGVFALAAVLMLTLKILDPAHTGLWRGAHAFFIGKIDNPAEATDLLGIWLYPMCVGVLALCWMSCRMLLVRTVSRIARSRAATSAGREP